MFFRKIGKIIRGDATPLQITLGCVLASCIAFMPSLSAAPGLLIALTLLLIVFNANLAMAALVAGFAKLLALALAPVTFEVGRFFLDGPTSALFQSMINAPVLALFGFEYYLTTGGLVMGLAAGLLFSALVIRLLANFRGRMAKLEKDSETFKKYVEKTWVKAFIFIFVGGSHGKLTYEDLVQRRYGNPIRTLGVVFAVVCVAFLVILQMFAAGPIVAMVLQSGLEKANGATVDVESADLNLKENRLTVTGLAMADPAALDTDRLRAATVEANLSGVSLLRKRLKIDRVILNDCVTGMERKSRGELIGKPPEPAPAPPKEAGQKTIEDYLETAKIWKERLAKAKEWIDKINGPKDPRETGEKKETLKERLEREIREKGYAKVKASHLITEDPTLVISEVIAEKIRVKELEDETLDLRAENLSTHPHLLPQAPKVTIRSSKDTVGFDLELGTFAPESRTDRIQLHWNGLPVDSVMKQLKIAGTPPMRGGTLDLKAAGTLARADGASIDLPLQAIFHNTTVQLPQIKERQVETLEVPIGLQGPIDQPRIQFDAQAFSSALAKAGFDTVKSELADKAKSRIGEELNEKVGGELGDKIGEQGKKLLEGVLGGRKKKQEGEEPK